MQLNITTDYALRIILCLKGKGNRKTSSEIAEEMAIPERYVLKILRKLKQRGVICSFAGNQGGYELSKPLSKIMLMDILVLMENTVCINRCLEEDEYCSMEATSFCPIRKFYVQIQEEIVNKIMKTSIQDVLDSTRNVDE